MPALTDARRLQVTELFAIYDADKSGKISLKELGNAVRALGYTPSNAEIESIIADYDKNADGQLNFDEFVALIESEKGLAPPLTNEQLTEAFKVFDKDGSGALSRDELKAALTGRGEKMSEAEVDAMIKTFDVDGDGKIKYSEFVNMNKAASPTKTTAELVIESWGWVKPADGNLAPVGKLFYENLFGDAPELVNTLFKGVDREAQAGKLMTMIDAAVGLLGDNDKLVPVLITLGERHAGYGVQDEHYPVVAKALIATLRQGLGEKLTDAHVAAWVAIYGVMEAKMKEGSSSENGKRLAAEYAARNGGGGGGGAAKKDDGAYDLRTRSAVVAQRTPIGVTVEAGKTYYWCTCGKSKSQPWCDGSHAGTEFQPMAWTATESKEVHFCACKQTKNAPFCDGSHAAIPTEVKKESVRSKVNWTEISQKLPTDKANADEKKKRKEMFKAFDPNGNGYLSLAECQKGIRDVLALEEIFDSKPVMMRAFQAAKNSSTGKGKTSKHGPDFVEFREFRLFLIYVRQYFELWQMFDEVDTADDSRIDLPEFKAAIGKIAAWGLKIDDAEAEFKKIDKNGGGQVLFDEFADWALAKKLDLEDDDDEDETA